MTRLKKGILVTVEGIDGSGKSSLVQNLYDLIKPELANVLLTKEPGGSQLGKHLRTILQEQTIPITAKAEFLLFAADRAQHFAEVIIPTLAENTLIISDRLCDSSVVYQGYGRGLDLATIQAINIWAMNGIKPDLTFYVRIDPKIAYQRLVDRGKLSAFDQEPLEFFEKLVEGFEQLYQHNKEVIILDGTLAPHELAQKAKNELIGWIQRHKLL
jgi:dTMP kinase